MNYETALQANDRQLAEARLRDFVPTEIYDVHAHPYHPAHFSTGTLGFLQKAGVLGCGQHRAQLQRYMPAKTVHALYFGMPETSADRPAMNAWVRDEVARNGTALSRSLMVASPADAPEQVAAQLRSGRFCGLKVYHCYSGRADSMHATIEEYAPEWMWEILHEIRGVLLLHIVRDDAMEDPANQASIRRLCRAYPGATLILAHVARSFNYRNARQGLRAIADLDNAVIDTSAVCEAESFAAALQFLGPRRVLWGSDFPVSEMRGRCVTTGDRFFWLHPEMLRADYAAPTATRMTLIGIESLLCLREACEDAGLDATDIQDIFLRNALRTLAPHLPASALPPAVSGAAMWQQARQSISCGTGLQSKRAELFDPQSWPSYFSRSSGCEVWDLNDRRHVDFAGGIGAVLLGYADPDVTAAVRRRLLLGSYSSLVNPQELELAEKLLQLHPWAGKVRYARGGGEAMAMSVRIARAATGRSGIAFCGYHGWQDWYLAANLGESTALDGHLLPGLQPRGVPRELKGTSVPFRYNDFESFERALQQLGGNLAAVVMEPMRSQLPQDDFVARIAARCRAAGAVFVVDEVTSGLRYGYPGAMARLGIAPDIAVYAKAMSNGIPFGTVVGRREIMEAAEDSFISSSYWTDGLGTAAALAVLAKMERLDVSTQVRAKGEWLQGELRQLAVRYPACRLVVGGMPSTPTMVFDLGEDASPAQSLYIRKMQARGLLVSSIYYLMLAHEQSHLDQLVSAADAVLAEMTPLIESGQLAAVANVPRGRRGFTRLA